MAAASELIGGILVVLGLFTRIATIMLIGKLVVAIVVTSANGFMALTFPLSVMTGFIMLFIAGSGKYSVDNILTK